MQLLILGGKMVIKWLVKLAIAIDDFFKSDD